MGAVFRGPWRKIGSIPSATPYAVTADAGALGCFAGAFPASPQGGGAGSPRLPLLVAIGS
jgi:hypothetical protein